MIDPSLIDALVRLRMDSWGKHMHFRGDEGSRTVVAHLITNACAGVQGDIQTFVVAGQLKAAVFTHALHLPFLDERGVGLFVEADPHTPGALDWTRQAVLRTHHSAAPPTYCTLMTRHLALLPTLKSIGLGIDSIGLIGESAPALSALVTTADPPREMHGLTITPLHSEAQIDAVVALRRAVFTQHPEYCWFGARPRHLQALRARMVDTLKRAHFWHVMTDAHGTVQGIFGCDLVPNNPFWGPRGGLEIIFSPEIHGRGFAKTAYRITLEGLVDQGYPIYRGTTGNPAVLAIGQQLGRRLVEVNLRSGADFPRSHFGCYLER